MKYEHIKEKKQADLNLYVCGEDEDLEPGVRYGPVIRECYIIECCTGGFGSVVINGREFPIKPRDCYVLFPGDTVIHTADFKEPRKGVWCGIGGMKISSYLKSANISSQQPFAPEEAFDKITEQIKKMLEMKDCADPGAELRRCGCIHNLFGEILRFSKSNDDKGAYIQKAISIMEVRYSEKISVPDIAAELSLERCYFSTLFKEKTGKTPHEFLTELRIKKACMLMENSEFAINEIAQAVGIEPVNFSRVFKKYTNKLPSEYKNRL